MSHQVRYMLLNQVSRLLLHYGMPHNAHAPGFVRVQSLKASSHVRNSWHSSLFIHSRRNVSWRSTDGVRPSRTLEIENSYPTVVKMSLRQDIFRHVPLVPPQSVLLMPQDHIVMKIVSLHINCMRMTTLAIDTLQCKSAHQYNRNYHRCT